MTQVIWLRATCRQNVNSGGVVGRWYRWRDCQVRLRLCLRPCVLGSVPPVITKKLLSGKLTGVRRNYQNILGATLLNWKKKKEKRKNRKKEIRRKAWSNKPGRKKLSFFESVRDLLINLRYISFVHVVTGSSLSFDENQWTFLLFQFIAVMWFHSFYTDLWAPKWSRKPRCLSHLLMNSLRVKFKSKKIGSEW